jgi:hypothetical protein
MYKVVGNADHGRPYRVILQNHLGTIAETKSYRLALLSSLESCSRRGKVDFTCGFEAISCGFEAGLAEN